MQRIVAFARAMYSSRSDSLLASASWLPIQKLRLLDYEVVGKLILKRGTHYDKLLMGT
jgi:hypothetical protein